MSSKTLRVLITTGDADGIGWEVTCKALRRLGPRPRVQFIYFRSKNSSRSGPTLRRPFTVISTPDLRQALALPCHPSVAIEILSDLSPPMWVEDAARACMTGDAHGLVTAPLSKTAIASAGMKDIGHTEILARISGREDLFMGFLGAKFSVLLATGHLPLRDVASKIGLDTVRSALRAARQLRSLLPKSRRELPLALVGLNPHAGEEGLLGHEEEWMSKLCIGDVRGPLVPDAAFLPMNWRSHSVYVCPYHDQGLIPFKMIHGFDSGVHLTMGLPFVRTSVDHGTAKNLFGKGVACAGSMEDALTTAVRLAREKSK